MARKEFVVEEVQKMMENIDNVRNVAIVAHVDHGKTTLTDSLVARAGLISKELAGEQRWTDFDPQEQARGITIKSADISLSFNFEGVDHLINLIDTPGHVDFGFHVVRAMRAVDGICLVVDAVEGVMPQTETNLRQALKERAKPVLFINKIDRLINELKLDSNGMQQRFLKIINQVNKIISANAPPDKVNDWLIDVNKGNVAFGTAFNKWALSIKSMKKFNISFKEMYERCVAGDHKYLVERSPLDEVLLEIIITHLPSPRVAQPYRIPVLWKHGDLDTEYGKSMIACDANGKPIGVVFGVVYDEHAGEVAVIRFFSGKVEKGVQLYISSKKTYAKVQSVGVYMGPDRVPWGATRLHLRVSLLGGYVELDALLHLAREEPNDRDLAGMLVVDDTEDDADRLAVGVAGEHALAVLSVEVPVLPQHRDAVRLGHLRRREVGDYDLEKDLVQRAALDQVLMVPGYACLIDVLEGDVELLHGRDRKRPFVERSAECDVALVDVYEPVVLVRRRVGGDDLVDLVNNLEEPLLHAVRIELQLVYEPVDLVDEQDRLGPLLERLPEHRFGLRHDAFNGIDN